MPKLPRRKRNDNGTDKGTSHNDDAAVEADQRKLNMGVPRGTSGRGHTEGFLDYEEFNDELVHPDGHAVYDKMYRSDGDIRQVVQLTSNPIISGTWSMIPYGGQEAKDEDQEVADFVTWALWEAMHPNFPAHLQTLLPVLIRSAFAPFELAWKYVDYTDKNGKTRKVTVLRTAQLRLPRTIDKFEQDRYGELTRIKQIVPVSPAHVVKREGSNAPADELQQPNEIWIEKQNLLFYRLGGEGDNWEGVSLLRPAYKHWLMKDMIERIDAIAQEREALGVPICYPPLGATDPQLDAAETVLKNMRTNDQSYIVAPGPKAGKGAPEGQGWLFEVIGYDRTGSGRDPQPSLEYHTLKIAAAFLAEFMRLGHGNTGARATAQVQQDPHLMGVEALVNIVENAINDQLVKPIVKYNYPGLTKFPKLQMSQVDSTSLSQLADYILKLTQIGALLPDQELEDFLRARADLPAANAESVRKRKKEDDEIRRTIVTGGGGNGDAYGANAPVGKHGNKSATVGSNKGKGSQGKGTNLDVAHETTILSYESPAGRWRYREPHGHELHIDFDYIEDRMDAAPSVFDAYCGGTTYELAKSMVAPDTDLGAYDEGLRKALSNNLRLALDEMYDDGRACVHEEIRRQADAYDLDVGHLAFDRGARDRGRPHLDSRSNLAASRVLLEMQDALLGTDLSSGNAARIQAAAEEAGKAAIRRVAFDHGISAFLHGRHDEAVTLDADESNGVDLIGVRYSAMLDGNTCDPCREADDGKLRDLDDPVRLERQPPNPHCHSTRSGFNRCRCIETYELRYPEGVELSESTTLDDAPDFVVEVATALIEKGINPSRAINMAKNIAKVYCRTGKWPFPGMRPPGADRAAACAAADLR